MQEPDYAWMAQVTAVTRFWNVADGKVLPLLINGAHGLPGSMSGRDGALT
jgi:hypothetical protein